MAHKILTIDDHEVVREGVKGLFSSGLAEFGEARNGPEAMSLIREQDWDIAILDISLAGRSGLDVLKEIKQTRPKLPVLMLSMHAEDQYAMRAFKAGASGYISKASSRDELRQAVLKVINGGRYVSPSMAERMVLDLNVRERAGHEHLSDRELEVLCLIASGKTVGEIAKGLSLSDKTISTYRRRILDKMQLNTNAELTYYAIRNGLVE
ncbi:MAG TPA: response regulator transcription factor [Pyrinomonadaceae bacterium]|jgi:two-component system, NarL family, invasion response regulator UvrY|nr:response regulator transcription factor [Pyrinomonadaceae bacterium]